MIQEQENCRFVPSHLSPWRTSPHSISPQWSQKAGARYEWTNRQCGRIWKSSTVAEAVENKKIPGYEWIQEPDNQTSNPPSFLPSASLGSECGGRGAFHTLAVHSPAPPGVASQEMIYDLSSKLWFYLRVASQLDVSWRVLIRCLNHLNWIFKKQELYSKLPLDVQTVLIISKPELSRAADWEQLYLRSHSFGPYPKLLTFDEGWAIDWLVIWDWRLPSWLPLQLFWMAFYFTCLWMFLNQVGDEQLLMRVGWAGGHESHLSLRILQLFPQRPSWALWREETLMSETTRLWSSFKPKFQFGFSILILMEYLEMLMFLALHKHLSPN